MNDQRSLTDQMRDLRDHANRVGMYDAADWITYNFKGLSGVIQERRPMEAPPAQKLDLAGNQMRLPAKLRLVKDDQAD